MEYQKYHEQMAPAKLQYPNYRITDDNDILWRIWLWRFPLQEGIFISKMHISDRWVKNANGPLSPLHYALHSQLYPWKISSHCAANVCRKPILQYFMAVLREWGEWPHSLQSSHILWYMLFILKELEKEHFQSSKWQEKQQEEWRHWGE